jgi:hypothetical protein
MERYAVANIDTFSIMTNHWHCIVFVALQYRMATLIKPLADDSNINISCSPHLVTDLTTQESRTQIMCEFAPSVILIYIDITN